MAESTDIQLCDAVKGFLKDQIPDSRVVRTHLPSWFPAPKLRTDLLKLHIEVTPGSQPMSLDAESEQSGLFAEWPVIVSFGISLTAATQGQVDSLLDQVEAVRRLIQDRQFGLPGVSLGCTTFEYRSRLWPDTLSRQDGPDGETYTGTFVSVLQFPFRELS